LIVKRRMAATPNVMAGTMIARFDISSVAPDIRVAGAEVSIGGYAF